MSVSRHFQGTSGQKRKTLLGTNDLRFCKVCAAEAFLTHMHWEGVAGGLPAFFGGGAR